MTTTVLLQGWALEMTAYCYDDCNVLFDRNGDKITLKGRHAEMVLELMAAADNGVEIVWYGNIENAEPVNIAAAVADIMRLDEDAIGEGEWGEWKQN